MELYQQTFIELSVQHQALTFGEYKLKSGRISPYFFNMGKLASATALKTIGECYASALFQFTHPFDSLFGPAYKGIPLVCATAISLAAHHQRDIPYSFNRKETKDHGEGGSIIGSPLNQRVMILDDVITAGTAIRESIELIHAAKGSVAGIIVALDRQEQGETKRSALEEIQQDFAIPVKAIIHFEDIMEYISHHSDFSSFKETMNLYRERYGVQKTSSSFF